MSSRSKRVVLSSLEALEGSRGSKCELAEVRYAYGALWVDGSAAAKALIAN